MKCAEVLSGSLSFAQFEATVESTGRAPRTSEAIRTQKRDTAADVLWRWDGILRGHDGVREWWKGLLAVFPDWRPSIVEDRDLGDFLLVHTQTNGQAAGSGVNLDEDFWQAVEMKDGRYIALRTEQEALEAIASRK